MSFLEHVLRTTEAWRGKSYSAPRSDPELDTEIWFRGHSRTSHVLVPGAYRRNWDHESMFNRFVAAGAGVLSPGPRTEWDWYFAAQHYELPTRLLDWTDEPLAALYFAVRGMLAEDAKLDVADDDPPVVWMMDAGSLNALVYGMDEVIVPFDDGRFSQYWKPGAVGTTLETFLYDGNAYTNGSPIAVWPTRTTPRIMAQNGCFTVHGVDRAPVDEVFRRNVGKHADRMVRITVQSADRVDRELSDIGMSRLRLFPELQNVAGRLRRWYSD